jgi:hypothetical protein
LLKEAVRVPMKQRNPAYTLIPMYSSGIIDNRNEIEKDLAKNRLRLLTGADCGDDWIHVDTQTWKLTMEIIVPMQDIMVFPSVLRELVNFITFSEVAFTSVLFSRSTRQAFFWGRKVDGSIKCPHS